MSHKVLISAPYFQPVIGQYQHVFDHHDIELVVPEVHERLSEEELLGLIEDIEGVISGDDAFTKSVLEKAKCLKVISKWGTGIDSIDLESANSLNIDVCNTPNAFTQPVSDSVLGYILCFARKLPWMDRDMRAGNWKKRPGIALHEACLGIIGVGNIGKAVAHKAKGFGMKLIGHDVVDIDGDFTAETGIEMVGRESLFERADFVTLNCTLTPDTFHIINEQALQKMKESAYLINTARGPLIDEGALVQALSYGSIAGAALDVFEQEPLPVESPLRGIDSCLMAPHNSNSSSEAWERVHKSTLDNLLNVLLAVPEASRGESRLSGIDKG